MAPAQSSGQAPSSLPEGLHLGGCRLLRVIGRGGMGEVYEAIQESLSRRVAVKVLPAHLAHDTAFIKRFERESDTLAQLSHPNLVAIYNRGHEGEHYFFILEYVTGKDSGPAQTLHQRLRSGEPLAIGEASKLIAQIGEAVAYAHEKGVIHRDIKAANILLDARGNARLLDFGIAHLVKSESGDNSRLTMTGEILGTAGYVAPEQRDGRSRVDARADIYSCGALCYELLTGRLPEGAFELPSEAVPGLDASWDILVEKALQRNPDRRFQKMAEFVEAVRNTVVAPPGTASATASVRPPPGAEARPPTAAKATPIVGQCPKCKTLNPGENRFCNECGTPMYEACPACKAENRVGTKYCGKCGVDVLKLKRLTQCRREAADLLSRAKAAPAQQAKALLHDLGTVLTRLFADSPSDAEGQKLKAEAQAMYRDLLLSEAEKAQTEASKQLDPIPLFTQAYAAITEAQREFPQEEKVTGKLNEVKTALRVAFLDRASGLDGNQAISLLQQMLQLLPDDADARVRLDRLNAELAAIKKRVQQLLAEGHFGQALLDLASGRKKFSADKDLRLLQTTAQSGQEKLVKLAEDEIPLLCSERRFVRMLERIDELSKLRSDIQGLQDARDRAVAALFEAEEFSANGDAHLAAGRLFLLGAEVKEALACYQKAKSCCSDYPRAISGAEKAEQTMERLARRRRTLKTTFRVLGTILLMLALVGAWALLKDWRDSRSAKAWAGKGKILYHLNHHQEAIDCFDKALKIDQQFADAWSGKGDALYSLDQFNEAIKCYDRTLAINPRHIDALCDKGASLQALGRWQEALEYCNKTLEINDREDNAWNNKGVVLRELNKYQEALECYDRALEINPIHQSAWSNKGALLELLGRREEAVGCYTHALEFGDDEGRGFAKRRLQELQAQQTSGVKQ
jgi:serine/threonine protein kinase/Tfp pilus assembly protein PilF